MKSTVVTGFIIFAAHLLSSGAAHAEEREDTPGMIDDAHSELSRRLSELAGQLDGYFSNDEESTQSNESWAKLRLDLINREGESSELKAKVKLKLVLPSTEKRLRLLLSTDEDDIQEPNTADSSTPANTSTDDGDVAVALRFLRTIRENSSLKFDLGARVLDGSAQTFVRIGGHLKFELNDDWRGTISNSAVQYSKSGYEDTLRFKFERFVHPSEKTLFLSSSTFSWAEQHKGAHIGQTLGLYRALGQKKTIAVETLLRLHTSPVDDEHRFRGTELRVRFRQNIWRDWFFYEVWPSVSWPQDREYERTYGGLIRIETVFGPKR